MSQFPFISWNCKSNLFPIFFYFLSYLLVFEFWKQVLQSVLSCGYFKSIDFVVKNYCVYILEKGSQDSRLYEICICILVSNLNYSGFLIDKNLAPSGCVIFASSIWPSFFCFSSYNSLIILIEFSKIQTICYVYSLLHFLLEKLFLHLISK